MDRKSRTGLMMIEATPDVFEDIRKNGERRCKTVSSPIFDVNNQHTGNYLKPISLRPILIPFEDIDGY
jgi:hypothetical protein